MAFGPFFDGSATMPNLFVTAKRHEASLLRSIANLPKPKPPGAISQQFVIYSEKSGFPGVSREAAAYPPPPKGQTV